VKEMSDQVRGILFVVVSLLILFAWGHFYKPPVPPAQTNAPVTSQQPASTGGAAKTSASAATTAAPTNAAAVEASAEQTVVVQSPLYRVELSNRGGVVKTWQLNKYSDDQKPPRPLDLVNDSVAQQLGWPFSLVLADPQLEAKANSGLYEIETHVVPSTVAVKSELKPSKTPFVPPAPSTDLSAPIEVDMHWSDGHLDVKKKLTFDLNYETTVEAAVTLDGKPQPVAVAWRGGFGDKAVYNAAQLVTVYYKTGGKLNLLQYKKLGVSGNQSQPAIQYGPLEFAGVEDQFFTAAFLPDGSDISLWHWMQNQRAGSGDGGGDDDGRAFARARVCRAERFGAPGKSSAAAAGAGEFWMDGSHREAAAVDFADAAHQGSQLGLVHRADDAGDQPGDVPAEDEELALDAEDAESGPGNPADSGSLQEIFDERSAQEKNE
jgi:YidC/Oxa1 family membrane protein insertase